jgi:outer membrane immunogenic protein
MKNVALLFVILFASTALVCAGPEPIPASGKEMKEVAPAPAPMCPNWTGFYVGAFGGYTFSNVDLDLDMGGQWPVFFAGTTNPILQHQPGDLDNDGGHLGGLIGYNFQWNNWVFGLEGAGARLWARDSDVSGIFVFNQANAYNLRNSFKTNYLATVGPRIGYAFCRWLPYVTGGVAIGDLDYDWDLINVGLRQAFQFRERSHKSETNAGWMIGGGLEYALTNHWRVRFQYQYVDLGSIEFHDAGFGIPVPNPFNQYVARHSAELTEHNASAALIFAF